MGQVLRAMQVGCLALLGKDRGREALGRQGGEDPWACEILRKWRRAMFGHVRKTRSDCTVGTYEKKHDFPTGTIRNPDGRKARKDKTLGSLRKDSGKEYR